MRKFLAVLAFFVLTSAAATAGARELQIYFIDVEGGQSTLIVTPAGESLLIDTGYPARDGRDPDRIQAAMRDAKISSIDYLLITHMHEDHNGGAAELARRVPIGAFIDYGSPVETGDDVIAAFAAYSEARDKAGKNGPPHIVPKPGDRIPLLGVDVRVMSVDGQSLSSPLEGAGQPNAACNGYEARPFATRENPRSLGIHLRYGRFRFLDLGDLVGPGLVNLVCPNNLIGDVDAYLLTHHADVDTNVPPVLAALRPRVAISNNGGYKGGSPQTFASLREHPEVEGVWQLHKAMRYGVDENYPDAFIANLDFGVRDHGMWLKLVANDDGSFSVTNGRTGWTRPYEVRSEK